MSPFERNAFSLAEFLIDARLFEWIFLAPLSRALGISMQLHIRITHKPLFFSDIVDFVAFNFYTFFEDTRYESIYANVYVDIARNKISHV